MPERIVSLVPSLTELVCWLGRGDALVGRTRFCTEPPEIRERVAVIGGTKNPKVARIVALAPDLVIANKEENRREDIEALMAAGLDVLLTDPNAVPEALTMVADVGDRLDSRERAAELISDVRRALIEVAPARRVRIFAAVWKEPLMGLASGTYGDDLLRCAGAENVLADRSRYPELSIDQLASLRPDLIVLPDEPYPFKQRDCSAFTAIAPARVIDGKLLWWYGPRMPQAIRALRAILAEARP
jgi:ABC-type hemin transport system substrate-binding protein